MPARSMRKPSPFGVVLVMSPWNYPFLLTMEPLIEAIAAGNTVVLKPSAYAPNTSALLEKLMNQYFDPRLVSVVTGGREENQALLDAAFDHIFFTGSQHVGKEVMRKAASHLTPVTLELGGKSPCIVERSATSPRCSPHRFREISQLRPRPVWRRIIFTATPPFTTISCAHSSPRSAPSLAMRRWKIQTTVTSSTASISTDSCGLIDPEKIAYGGRTAPENLQIEPTILRDVEWGDAIMQEEIFGPILPVRRYENFGDAIDQLNDMPRPLALYIFHRG